MTQQDIDRLARTDTDGLLTYEFIANNVDACDDMLPQLIQVLCAADRSGQFTASAARFLNAVAPTRFASAVAALAEATIDRDREHRYLADLMLSLYGPDCAERAAELSAEDRNFRRMYKRVYPDSAM